jgi:hypothetical protein
LKKSFGLRAAQIRQLGVAESRTYRRDMPSIRLLDLTNLVMALASKHFFNGLLGVALLNERSSFGSVPG